MTRPLSRSHIRRWLPQRRKDAHKGDMGRIYIVAGSRGMVGAGVLATMGAVRMGAGLVRLGTVRGQQKAVVIKAPVEATTDALPEGKDGRLSAAAWAAINKGLKNFKADVLAAGPGLGQSAAVGTVVKRLVLKLSLPMVLDADGLNILAENASLLRKHRGGLVITPHEGELARLLKRSASWIRSHREEAVQASAKKFGCVCLLKGSGTLVSDGSVIWKNPTGNAGMASGGMGDVLTGMVAALLARVPPLKAACIGAYLHGLSGDIAAKKISKTGFLASDLAGFIPQAVAKI